MICVKLFDYYLNIIFTQTSSCRMICCVGLFRISMMIYVYEIIGFVNKHVKDITMYICKSIMQGTKSKITGPNEKLNYDVCKDRYTHIPSAEIVKCDGLSGERRFSECLVPINRNDTNMVKAQMETYTKLCVQELECETRYDMHRLDCEVQKSAHDVEIRKAEMDSEIRKIELENQKEQSEREHTFKMAEIQVRMVEAQVKLMELQQGRGQQL